MKATRAITAGELRAMLEDVPDDLPVVAADTLTGPRRAVTGVWYDEAGPVLATPPAAAS